MPALPVIADATMSQKGSSPLPCPRTHSHMPVNAVSAPLEPREVDLVEFACGDESTIGIIGPKLGCRVCRLAS